MLLTQWFVRLDGIIGLNPSLESTRLSRNMFRRKEIQVMGLIRWFAQRWKWLKPIAEFEAIRVLLKNS